MGAMGSRLMSMPISATITRALNWLRPGRALSIWVAARNGSTLTSTS